MPIKIEIIIGLQSGVVVKNSVSQALLCHASFNISPICELKFWIINF